MVGYLLCGSCIQPKNSLKFKLLAFWRKQTPFIDQKCTYEKVKKFGQGLPPPHLDKMQKNRKTETFPYIDRNTKYFLFSIYSAIRINRRQHVFSSRYPIVYAHKQKRMCIVHSACGQCKLKQSGLKVVWQGVSIFCVLPIRPYAAIWINVKRNV